MDTREKLIEAAQELLWDRGYAATSPRAILDVSGAGQGSMYHHFRGKEALAMAAVERNGELIRQQIRQDLGTDGTALQRIETYLRRERQVLRGCRFGKLAQDPDVMESDALSAEVAEMFVWMQASVTTVIEDGKAAGEFPASLDSASVSAAVVAALQGAFVLARAAGDATAFDEAIEGVLELLRAVSGTA